MRVKIDFADFSRGFDKGNNYFLNLLKERFDVEVSDDPDFLLYAPFGQEHRKYKCIKIFYTGENIRPNFNECDYAFSFDHLDSDRHYRLPFYVLMGDVSKLIVKPPVEEIIQTKKKFCNFVYSNDRAKERIEFFHLLSKYKKVDAGGKVLNNIGYQVADKLSFLNKYKFTISFENSSFPGYTTEKIIQPMMANSIPIYWGNELVGNEFNEHSFINVHRFKNFEEAIERIIEIDQNDDLYRKILAEPYFKANVVPEYFKRENILDKFEQIFARKNKIIPVATSWKARLSYLKEDTNNFIRYVKAGTRKHFRRLYSKGLSLL